MCGIAGIITAGALDDAILRRLIAPLAHRGPDDEGVWIDGDAGIGLGHRRLSIVDLSPSGRQPMHSADGRYVISFNGEIYNHAELRRELDGAGAAPVEGWRGHSDTETLIQAISVWGLMPALAKLVGMFAFALWDRQERALKLVRDRFGEKPLYYGWAGQDFVFASELKALRAHPRFDDRIDRRALRLFVARGYVPAPLSIYQRAFKLPPGCVLEVGQGAAAVAPVAPPEEGKPADGLRLTRYWSYRDVVRSGRERPIADEREALDLLEEALASAVRGQSLADVPVGAFLSGGIDSSTVVALYQRHSPVPVRTFSIGFEEAGFDEAKHAKAVAAHLGTVHHEHYVTADEARDVIPLLPEIYDEPFSDSSQIPTYLVSRFAREQVTVALSGDGGDELFAGYNRHVALPKLWRAAGKLPRPLRQWAGAPLAKLPPRFWEGVAGLLQGGRGPQLGDKLHKAFRVAAGARSFDDVCARFLDEWSGGESPVLGGEGGHADLDLDVAEDMPDAVRLMYCDAVTYLPDDILCKVDRAAMAVSLETRVPFLDHRVAELAARIPHELKLRDGKGKHLLRQLLYRHAPPELFDRPKAGFAIPIGAWIKGPLRAWAEELLEPSRMAAEGWFDPAIVHRRWREHLGGRGDSTQAIWSILMFQAWLRAQHGQLRVAA